MRNSVWRFLKQRQFTDKHAILISAFVAVLSYGAAFLALIGVFQGNGTNWAIAILACIGLVPLFHEADKADKKEGNKYFWKVIVGLVITFLLLLLAAVANHKG